jgi:hypothetical protein
MHRPRISFECVALLDSENDSISDVNDDDMMDRYYELLRIFGLTEKEYEAELSKKIDREWSVIHRKIVLNGICLN